MNLVKRIPLFLLILLAMLALAGCGAVKGTLVMGDTYRLESGQTLEDDLTVMGGVAELEEDSTVQGDVSVMGGTLRISGLVEGDISVIGGSVVLTDTARVDGDVTQVGGSVSKAEGAVVGGVFDKTDPTIRVPRGPMMGVRDLDPILSPFMAFFQSLAIAALAVLVFLFAARPMERVGQAVIGQPVVSGGIGLLTVVVAPALLVILGITIILLPVTFLGIILFVIAWAFGWIALGLATGRNIARMFNRTWTDPVSAGVGTLVLSLVASLFNLIIPCIGGIPGFLAGIIGLGAVVATRFGTVDYTGAAPGYSTSGTGGPVTNVTPPPTYTPAAPSQYSAPNSYPAQHPLPEQPPSNDFFGPDDPTPGGGISTPGDNPGEPR